VAVSTRTTVVARTRQRGAAPGAIVAWLEPPPLEVLAAMELVVIDG
jgi:hypothetical protein